jgi:hypothetical protein
MFTTFKIWNLSAVLLSDEGYKYHIRETIDSIIKFITRLQKYINNKIRDR